MQHSPWILALLFTIISLPATLSEQVSCRCGSKPWSTKDPTALEPTRECCDYFVESGEGSLLLDSSLCQIENEYIYKRFHSCCVSRIKNAYCYQAKMIKDKDKLAETPVTEDPWKKYEKIFGNEALLG